MNRNKRVSHRVVVEISRPGPFKEKDACRFIDRALSHAQTSETRIEGAKQFSRVMAFEKKRTVVTVITTEAKDV